MNLGATWRASQVIPPERATERLSMEDLIWIAVTIAFFAVAIGYVHFCDHVK
jgi:hypothetical protein